MLKTTMPVFEKYAHRLIDHFETKGLRTNVDMQDFFMRYTLSGFGEVGLGAQLRAIEEDVNRFAIAFDYVQTAWYGPASNATLRKL